MAKKFLAVLCLGILSFTVYGKVADSTVNVQISGIFPTGNVRFSAVEFKDYISLTPLFLSVAHSENGKVHLKFPLSKPKWVRITGLAAHADIIAVPGNSYQFTFASDAEGPYLSLQYRQLPANDPNLAKDSLNVAIDRYLITYGTRLYTGGMKEHAVRFCDSLENAFSFVPNALFQTYLSFRLEEIRLLAKASSDVMLFRQRFRDNVFNIENPDYASAFKGLYQNRLSMVLLKRNMSYGQRLINNFHGADTVKKWIAQENAYPMNSALGEGALLFGLEELLQNKSYSADAILALFHEFSEKSIYPIICDLSSRLYAKHRMPVSGEKMPEIQLVDKAGNTFDLFAQGNRRTYLCFFDPSSKIILDELAAINEIKKTLKEKMNVVSVIINTDGNTLTKIKDENRLAFDLYKNGNMEMLSALRIKNDCNCMVISSNGTFVVPSAPVPSAPETINQLITLAKTGR